MIIENSMRITVFQQDKKISVNFIHKDIVDKYAIDRAEEFLVCIDKLLRKRKISLISFIGQIGHIEFKNAGILTERVIRVIILGLSFQ